LIQVTRGGNWVSGVVCHPQQGNLTARILGVRNGDAELIRQGAASTLYYAAIHWANESGYEAVDFLGTWPLLHSGLFQHKRKWGASVRIPKDMNRWIWIGIRRITPAVRQFLKDHPFAVLGREENLHGLIFVEDPHKVSPEETNEWERRYVTPGLDSLLIRSIESFVPGSESVNQADLVIPIALNCESGNRQ
jgi:hypothetical protein